MQTRKTSRPADVTALAVLAFVTGIIFLLGGVALLSMPNQSTTVLTFGAAHLPLGILFLVVGAGVWACTTASKLRLLRHVLPSPRTSSISELSAQSLPGGLEFTSATG